MNDARLRRAATKPAVLGAAHARRALPTRALAGAPARGA